MVLIIIAVLGAIAVFAGVSSYVSKVNTQVGSKVAVLALKNSRSAFAVIQQGDLKTVEVPKRWVDPNAITDSTEVVGHKLAVRVSAGSTLTPDVLVAPTDQTQHERFITIKVDAVTGVRAVCAPVTPSTPTRSTRTWRACPNKCGCSCTTSRSSR
ncbi:hypothetical protein [Flexivirga alba]|uniref:SAF domain-containing protein n=1 Tax=Flexivirga alba TaxID=702742 RepID=A0ABW2AM71_9MICO